MGEREREVCVCVVGGWEWGRGGWGKGGLVGFMHLSAPEKRCHLYPFSSEPSLISTPGH